VVSVIVSGPLLHNLLDFTGPRLMSLEPQSLPAVTRAILHNFDALIYGIWAAAVISVVGAFAATRLALTPVSAEHTISLTTSFLYHLVLCVWAAAVIALVILPAAKGI
jgi:hypothetical protein